MKNGHSIDMAISKKLIEEYLEANDSPYAPMELLDGTKGIFTKEKGADSFCAISRSWNDVLEHVLSLDGTPGAKRYLASLQASRIRHRKSDQVRQVDDSLARSQARIKRKEEGNRLKAMRTLRGMTQKELSLLTGIKQPSICEMEKGRCKIPEKVWELFEE